MATDLEAEIRDTDDETAAPRGAVTSGRRLLAAALVMVNLPIVVATVRALARGWQPIGDNGILLVRSDLYASAARGTYEDTGTYVNQVYGGRTQERRALGDAEHCHTVRTRAEAVMAQPGLEGCVELAAKGWQPIGSLPKIGQSPCRSNCKCTKIYR